MRDWQGLAGECAAIGCDFQIVDGVPLYEDENGNWICEDCYNESQETEEDDGDET